MADLIEDGALTVFRQDYSKIAGQLYESQNVQKKLLEHSRGLAAKLISYATRMRKLAAVVKRDEQQLLVLREECQRAWHAAELAKSHEDAAQTLTLKLKLALNELKIECGRRARETKTLTEQLRVAHTESASRRKRPAAASNGGFGRPQSAGMSDTKLHFLAGITHSPTHTSGSVLLAAARSHAGRDYQQRSSASIRSSVRPSALQPRGRSAGGCSRSTRSHSTHGTVDINKVDWSWQGPFSAGGSPTPMQAANRSVRASSREGSSKQGRRSLPLLMRD